MADRFRKKVSRADLPRELLPGQSTELLKTLHLVDARGNLQADSRRKLKQVNHLVRLLTPALDDVLARHGAPVIVDAAAGNAYLGFVLYELFLGPAGRGELVAVEPRPDLAARVRERAAALGYERLRVLEGPVQEVELPERVHALVALHACDTATDDALLAALARQADHVAVVPCCQAEVARQLKELAPDAVDDPGVRALWKHPWHRRELGSHLTNVLRALALEARGHQVTVTELAGWEHAVKNELILARRVGREHAGARRELEALLARIPVRPTLARGLGLGA
ncbi:MAG: SAM-dependent methyltransferase [Planctomycetes bacterium]|nr:SAM-dependent methyltransferase [Planctomycetota bacterium]